MHISLSDLKLHVLAFVRRESAALSGEIHSAVARFADFVEGQQAVADAVELLEKNGYTINSPPSVAGPL